jgi:hypothetical protein
MSSLIKIPRNIFQTWSTKNISSEFKSLSETWTNLNPNYAYFLYDDYQCDKFIKKHFDNRVYNAYIRLIPGAFKADLWRYCILYIYGGVYADMDTICMNPIDSFLNENIEFMTPIDLNPPNYNTGTHNLFNAFIASVPKHPILLDCIYRIVYHIENNIIPDSNLDFTGPGVLGRAVNIFLCNESETTSFIGKEGIHNETIYLLHFEQCSEYVSNEEQLILFQNKNGNTNIQNIYNEELKNVPHIDWGKCDNPIRPLHEIMESLPTIVTMFYNIREKEANLSGSEFNHSVSRYFEFAKKFLFQLPYPVIFFTDDNNFIEIIMQERNPNAKTYIYYKPFEETYYYKHLDKITELQKKFTIFNGHLEHETPMYIILNNNKHDFMESAIQLNPFGSSHFMWMDFGINHVALNTERIHSWISKIPDKIRQLCINPYIENTSDKEMFQCIYHHTAGGLFTGSAKNLLEYADLFKKKTEQIYAEDWYQIDEAVMTMIQRENPGLFDFFYGDYNGIISNYITPLHSVDIILRSVQKYIDTNRTLEAFNTLCYCADYFATHSQDNLVYLFLNQNIIVNYYHNNRLLLNIVIDLINLKQKSNDENERTSIHALLENNKANINFYANKQLIIPL